VIGLRALLRQPRFTAVAVLTLGVGVGGSSAGSTLTVLGALPAVVTAQTTGAWADGAFRRIDDTHNQIDLTFTMPDGEVWRYKEEDTVVGPNELHTVSYRFRDGTWVEQQRSVWARVPTGVAGQTTIDVRPGDEILARTQSACHTGRVEHVAATGLGLRVRGEQAPRRVDVADLLAVVKMERAPVARTPRLLATIGLGAVAAGAALAGRPRTSLALGLGAWWLPWWGTDERRRPRLIFRTQGALSARLDPLFSECDAIVRQVLGLAGRAESAVSSPSDPRTESSPHTRRSHVAGLLARTAANHRQGR
jgi:hypothetical protein